MEGAADIDKLAASVRGVQTATVASGESFANLERILQANTAAVLGNTAALDGIEGGFHRTTVAATGLAEGVTRVGGSARTASNELRMMEGAMPIRAAAQFLTQIEGLNRVMGVAFPIFGAVALVGVLDEILRKTGLLPKSWSAVSDAQKEATEDLKKYTKESEHALETIKAINREIYIKEHGKEAGAANEAVDVAQAAETAARHEKDVRAEAAAVAHFLAFVQSFSNGGSVPALSAQEQEYLRSATKGRLDIGAPGYMPGGSDVRIAEAAKKSLGDDLSGEVRAASLAADEARKRAISATTPAIPDPLEAANERRRKSEEELKKTQEAAKKAVDEFIKSVEKATETMVKSDEAYHAKLMAGATTLYGQSHNVFDEAQEGTYTSSVAGIPTGWQMSLFGQRNLDAMMASATLPRRRSQEDQAADLTSWWSGTVQPQERTSDQQQIALLQQASKHAAVGMDPAAELANTLKTLEAELRIKDIHADIWDMDKERFDAQMKASEAEYEYEQKIAALREQDLQKYEQLAGSLFDAIHGRTTNQWFRQFALGQEKQVFTNLATQPLKDIGQLLGSVTGGSNLGGVLTGTVFDPANKGADPHLAVQQKTADNTSATVDWLKSIYGSMTGQGGNPSTVSPGASTGGGIDLFNLPLNNSSTSLAAIAALATGTSSPFSTSALFQAGSSSGPAQFMSGLGGMGSNPLQAIFGGYSTNGSTVTQLTAAQQAGAAIGTATALAGAGLGIYSGIEQGGVGGYSKAASSGLGAAAMLDPDPLSKSILGGAAAIMGIVGALFGTGPQQRSNQIFNELASNQYLAPTALNVTQGMNGTYEDFDARGNLRTSTMSAVPTVAEPYITSRVLNGQRTYYNAPGEVTSPYSGGATGTGQTPVSNVTVHVNAIDTQSGVDFLLNNRNAIGLAVTQHLQSGGGEELASQMRYHTNGG
jgi:hypothetical protein